MSIIEAILLGVLQGITEFIPVSSSGHLLLAQELFGNDNNLVFDVFLHIGTLAALIVYFYRDLLELAKNLFKRNKQGRLAHLLIVATIPAVVAGLLFSGYIDDNLRTPFVVAVMLAAVAVVMLFADSRAAKTPTKNTEITVRQSVAIGLAQTGALIPGVSRSGATITAGMLLGLSRVQAARFSFLLAIPLVAGSAAGLIIKDSAGLSVGNWQLALGFVAAFVSGLAAIKFLLGIISRVGLKPFAYYRIVLAVVVLLFLA